MHNLVLMVQKCTRIGQIPRKTKLTKNAGNLSNVLSVKEIESEI